MDSWNANRVLCKSHKCHSPFGRGGIRLTLESLSVRRFQFPRWSHFPEYPKHAMRGNYKRIDHLSPACRRLLSLPGGEGRGEITPEGNFAHSGPESHYPRGAAAFSPGLRGTSYPGNKRKNILLPLLPRREERAGERRASLREVHGERERKYKTEGKSHLFSQPET